MRKILTIFLLFIAFFSKAQSVDTLECDAPDRDTTELQNLPWFGNNDYLEDFLDSIGYPSPTSRIIGTEQVRYHVPIKFWIYRNSAGVGGPDVTQLRRYIDDLNRFYNVDHNTMIGFYMKCEVGYVDNDDHTTVNNDIEGLNLIQIRKEKGCINIHIVDNIHNANGVAYRARFFGIDGILLSSATYTRPDFLSGTIAHEVGHYFELDHTHQYSWFGSRCYKEAIDRNRTWPTLSICVARRISNRVCEATGDLLRDTPADHNLELNPGGCTYGVTGQTDPWNDHYETPPAGSSSPNPRNLMSYNLDRSCRTQFSRLQIAVMLHSIVRGKNKDNKTEWEDWKGIYDEYEMDNFREAARNLQFNEVQERNFHLQYDGNVVGPMWSHCDVDWLQFTPPCSGTYSVETSLMTDKPSANTRLTLFDANLNQLAQNDDISPTDLYSRLSFAFNAGATYFIRVENMSPGSPAYYRVAAGALNMNGPDILCGTSEYSIANLPNGATVNWNVSPQGVVNPSCTTCNPVTLTTTSTGTVTLTATVTTCTGNIIVSKQLFVEAPAPVISAVKTSAYGEPTTYLFTANVVAGVTYNWYVGSTLSQSGTSNTFDLYYPCNSTKTVKATITYACGTSGFSNSLTYTGECIRTKDAYSLSPNPASSTITVSTSDGAPFKGASDYKITVVKIYDQQGALKKQRNFDRVNKANLNISDLPSGLYVVEVSDGDYKEQKQLLIQK